MWHWDILSAATTLVGADRHRIGYRHPESGKSLETRGEASAFDAHSGCVRYTVGIEFPVNGPPGEHWRMAVSYEPTDSYRVWLFGNQGLISDANWVHFGALSDAIVSLYYQAIETRNGGNIPE